MLPNRASASLEAAGGCELALTSSRGENSLWALHQAFSCFVSPTALSTARPRSRKRVSGQHLHGTGHCLPGHRHNEHTLHSPSTNPILPCEMTLAASTWASLGMSKTRCAHMCACAYTHTADHIRSSLRLALASLRFLPEKHPLNNELHFEFNLVLKLTRITKGIPLIPPSCLLQPSLPPCLDISHACTGALLSCSSLSPNTPVSSPLAPLDLLTFHALLFSTVITWLFSV